MDCPGGSTTNLRATDSELDDLSDEDMYADQDSTDDDDDDDEDEDGVAGAPSRHRLEWDNDL